MYELSRVLLKSVGPAGARYQDVLLDLSGVGRPVADDQLAFFGTGTTARRPSPATVLFLENGGGKSVLLKLIFSVVLPGRRNALGSAAGGVLERFVLEGDTAHVVLEWTHVRSGRRLITGKVSEWRDLRPSSDSRNLVERWYHFRPTAALGLENLPTADDNRYLRLTSYLEALKIADSDPGMEYDQFDRHREWTDRLTDLGLDPELFRYQRSMNADEGEAAEAFSFTSSAAFVTFLLNAVLPTDPPRHLAELLDTYAGQVSQRGQLVLEREFVEGSVGILAELAQTRSDAEEARRHKRGAAREMAVLLKGLEARAAAEAETVRRLDTEIGQLVVDLAQEQREHSGLCAVTAELERLVAGLRLEEAVGDCAKAEQDAALAARTVKAWEVMPTLLDHLASAQRLKDMRAVVEAAEEAARPALIARDHAASRLAAALDTATRTLARQAETAEKSAAESIEQAGTAQESHNQAVARAARHDSAVAATEKLIREVREAIDAATASGLLPVATPVSAALEQATAAAEANAVRISVLEAEDDQLEQDHRQALLALQAGQARHAEQVRRRDNADRDFRDASARTDALRTDPAFTELLGYPADALDTAADTLITALVEAHGRAAQTIVKLQVADEQDEPRRTALETNELLPAGPDTVQARSALADEGITAWTGWQYLAAIPDVGRRRALAEKLPHLAVGVLLNDPAQLPRAQELLGASELHPIGYLPVSTTAAMAAEFSPPGGVDFVVPPHPALYDEQAADAERRRLQQQHAHRQQLLAERSTYRDSAAALLVRLREWRKTFPPGRLTELQAELDTATEQAASGELEVKTLQGTLDQIGERRTAVKAAVKPLRSAQPGLEKTAAQLAELAARETKIPAWQEVVVREKTAAEQERGIARAAEESAVRFRARAADLVRQADGHRASVSRLTEESTTLGTVAPVPADQQPTEPLEVLRSIHASAAETYLRASVGDQLLVDLRRAEQESTELESKLKRRPADVRKRAHELLASPEGTDHASREAAYRLAELAAPELAKRAAELQAKLTIRREEYERFPVPAEAVDLSPFEQPRHISHGVRQITEAKSARDAAAQTLREMEAHRIQLGHALAAAKESHRSFTVFHAEWPEFAAAEPAELIDAHPFEGELEVAQSRHRTVRGVYDEAKRRAAVAQEAERKQADSLARHAGQQRFLLLGTASHQIMLNTDRGELPGFAAEWAAAMTRRLRSLTDDLSKIDRHRTQIVNQFAQQVREALQILKRAQRFSRLPKGLGDWSGQQFLQIRFKEPNEAVLHDRMGEIVDDLAQETVKALESGRELRRSGTSMILRGVASAAAPEGFTVSILKPDAVLRAERVPVSEIRSVFSGGQILTTAIILYCTMAALRANDRGRLGNHHSGTLFLDNPIGRASAAYLLRLQQSIATSLGVQLVYTTGIFDTTVLNAFPLVIRMRNDADLRAKRKYLSVEDVFGRYLDDQLIRSDGHSIISAARYFSKEKSVGDGGAE
ncbi:MULTISPECIES: hypothetical protein [Kitasatospora]|uniref:Uncharacterized protein n=1 Tax=Kitasatospora setae (strain ATCC 33774 / DSM 43861 / JCM 3304 / KCC A-0304 / NBRC 14216 / KM-6054) TaxID=452652 RepID=E4N681_KITSK|nr:MULTISPECIES: hypothetical protein [Kitasatospora]BAJ26712.1 hypothetical protein KSE_08750 [Kitasatospora setae KM-6054]